MSNATGSRATCPGCNGDGSRTFYDDSLGFTPVDCGTCRSRGFLVLPLEPAVLEDMLSYDSGLEAEFIDEETWCRLYEGPVTSW